MKREQFKIKEFTNPGGTISWRVFGMRTVDGVRKEHRQNFTDERLALTHKQALETEALNMPAPALVTTRLTEAQAIEAETCFNRLAGKSYSLTTAVEFALEHYTPSMKSITVTDAFALFKAAKLAANKRPLTVAGLERRLKAFRDACGSQMVSDIQPDALKPFIFRKDSGATNSANYYRAHTCFFNWCVNQKYCTRSPMAAIQPVEVDRGEPVALTLAECRALMNHAQQFKGGALVPYLALALFCGIRPTEVQRLTWSDLDMEEKTVNISAKIAKMRGRRIVAISENALAFLLPHAPKKAPFCAANFRKDMDALKALAGFGTGPDQIPWTPDVLRHTAISMHLAEHEHEGKTASWAGNSPDVIQQHYKALVKAKDAAEFWQIMPGVSIITDLAEAI